MSVTGFCIAISKPVKREHVDRSEDFVMTVDPNVCWGQYVVYQVDRSLYVYDMEAQKAKGALLLTCRGIGIIIIINFRTDM